MEIASGFSEWRMTTPEGGLKLPINPLHELRSRKRIKIELKCFDMKIAYQIRPKKRREL
jgi:hypothetical protein